MFSIDVPIPRVPVQNVTSELARRHSKDATEEESIKELTSKLEEVASQHADKVIKSRPASGKRSSDDSLDIVKADQDPKGKTLRSNIVFNRINLIVENNIGRSESKLCLSIPS